VLAEETIVAVSSAVGQAARMILRVSGPASLSLLGSLSDDAPDRAGAYRLAIRPPKALELPNTTFPAWVYVFTGPKSYTGQDLVELHLPGNPLLVRMIVEELIAQGARQAEAGEFTARAYLNGRLDLTAAEGVALTIAAQNDAELSAARQLLAGELSRRLVPIMESLAATLALVEAGIDFTEEDISFITPDDLQTRLRQIDQSLDGLTKDSARIERLSHEPTFALVGRPNVGKSTLLNALAREDRAVVSPVAGTTRDALSARIALERGMATLVDVAGLESVGDDPHGVNRQMQDKALRTIAEADFVLHVIDATGNDEPLRLSRTPDLIIFNKCDIVGRDPGLGLAANAVCVSALHGQNLHELSVRMSRLAFGSHQSVAALALGTRHLWAIERCRTNLAHATTDVTRASELIAYDLREALDALGSILGQVTPDDVLGRIFGAFCIGK
jgi:tRNA modification GTPase